MFRTFRGDDNRTDVSRRDGSRNEPEALLDVSLDSADLWGQLSNGGKVANNASTNAG
jgi:hypothetical protein